MCDFKGNFVAWMDGELSTAEAAGIEQHMAACSECRRRVSSYETASRDFAAIYTAAARQSAEAFIPPRRIPAWLPFATFAAVAAALALAFVLIPRKSAPPQTTPPAATIIGQLAQVAETKPVPPVKPVRTVLRRHAVSHPTMPQAEAVASEPTVRIAIPADAIYPPGAVPAGMAYFANVSFAADGSVQSFRFQR